MPPVPFFGQHENVALEDNFMTTKRNLKTLEFDKIIELLCEHAYSDMGKKACRNLTPSCDINEIETMQDETADALKRLYRRGRISFGGLTDIRASLSRTSIGASLSTKELLSIAQLLMIAKNAKEYNDQESVDGSPDCLTAMFQELDPIFSLEREITQAIISEEEISDEASSALKSIRRNMKMTNGKIRTQLSKIISDPNTQTMLQDNIITQRNNRYCIPVRAEHRNHFPGMVHDQSSTGATLFIEPMAIINLNNELTELAIKEQHEIERILAELSESVRFEAETILDDLHILKKLDFIFARAGFAKSYTGSRPLFNTEHRIQIKQARHPLLDSKKVIPIDISLGTDFHVLLITGPNTGGKTVSLKTLGLLTIMGQAGLHIPAFEGSELTVLDQVFADIGDEQSIEQNLSTFSSHMKNIVYILNHATENSLVLFDEPGGGTDPTEGAALAISILTKLHNNNTLCVATTHYSELKLFALSTEDVENASCEFDIKTLQPTYRLLIGVPGKSNAFAISKRLGLSTEIIDMAKSQLTEETTDFESLLADLERNRITIEKEQEQIKEYRQEIQNLKNHLTQKEQNLSEKKEKILANAKEEARKILEDAKNNADESIRKFNQWTLNPSKANNKEMEHERANLRKNLDNLDQKLTLKDHRTTKLSKPEDFTVGTKVYVLSLCMEGTIKMPPNAKGECMVTMGIMNSKVNIKDLELLEKAKEQPKKPKVSVHSMNTFSPRASVSPEINVVGKTVREALAEVDKYLDDAYLCHLNIVTIIHGKGTGKLRSAIHTYLKDQPHVKSFRNGVFGEGEMGVTVVEFN